MNERQPRVHRIRRRRLLTVLAWFTGLTAAAAAAGRGPAEPTTAVRYVVRAHDTLWTVAEQCGSARDHRELVWAIKQANGLTSATIYPGQVLLIPKGDTSLRRAARHPEAFRQEAILITPPAMLASR